VNLSVRAHAAAGDSRLIVGLVLGGGAPGVARPLLLRAVGPSLAQFGVSNALADPMLEVYDSTGFKIDQNDDWRGVLDFTTLGGFPFAGAQPKDAAIYNPFATAGAQTFHVLAKGAATGVVLAELYDAAPGQPLTLFTPRITNLSVRTVVGTGDNVLIVGLVIAGPTSQQVLIRAVGPALAAPPFNLAGTLNDPKLEIYNRANVLVADNDNWGTNAAQLASLFRAVGAFPLGAETTKDAALVATLPPGSYTAVVKGVGDTTGVGLVELYEVR
jgi:hypothetical protein